MHEKMKPLYSTPEWVVPQEVGLQYLSEQCAHLEEKVRTIAARLPANERQTIEAYIDLRDDLEVLCIKTAMRIKK